MAINVYLDESGNTGWKFDAPYRNGGSSRYLTIAFIICPSEKKDLIRRIVFDFYKKHKIDSKLEVKGSSMTIEQKRYIANQTVKLLQKNQDIKISYITVKKENVLPHIRLDNNIIYNYMMRLALLKQIETFEEVNLIRDNKTVKIKSGNTLINYLQTELYFSHSSKTKLKDIPSDSKSVKNLIFIDWINNLIWSNYEDNNKSAYDILRTHIYGNRLYFEK